MSISTDICNMALSHLGVGQTIQNAETGTEQEAKVCRTFYATCLASTLSDFDWSFARRYQALNLVEASPNSEWGYAYRYPTDCVSVKKILSGVRNDTRQSRVSYAVGEDDAGKLIYSDMDDAIIQYTKLVEDTTKYTATFMEAFSMKLAFYIAPRISAGDPFKRQQAVAAMYNMTIMKAKAQQANEEQPDQDPLSEFTRTRNGDI